jgi:SAM-dependent methyltransferase
MNDFRVEQFATLFPDAQEVLELGSMEGGHSCGLANRPGISTVLALEGRKENIERAEFVKRLLGVENIKFVQANLEEPGVLARFGVFDAVFCCGLLYHLPKPWELLAQIAQVSSGLFLSTHFCQPDKATVNHGGYDGVWYHEGSVQHPLSGLSMQSFWPTLLSLESMLQDVGFAHIEIVHTNEAHENGPILNLAARKEL